MLLVLNLKVIIFVRVVLPDLFNTSVVLAFFKKGDALSPAEEPKNHYTPEPCLQAIFDNHNILGLAQSSSNAVIAH